VLLAQRRWAWAPVRHMQHRHRRLRTATMARQPRPLPAVTMAGRPRPLPAVTMARRPRALPAATMARRPRPLPAVTMARRRPQTSMARADPVVPGTTTAPVDPVGPAHGMGIPSVATSTGPRGEPDPHPGDGVRRRGQGGADRSPRPVGGGAVAQSTTGATRKRPCGIRGSTNGASGSSGSGSPCKKPASHHARFALWRSGRCLTTMRPLVFRPSTVRSVRYLPASSAANHQIVLGADLTTCCPPPASIAAKPHLLVTISLAEKYRSGLPGGSVRGAKSVLAVRNISFAVRSCSPRHATGAARRRSGHHGTLPGVDLRLADPINRFLQRPDSKLGGHQFVKMSITLGLQYNIKRPDISGIQKSSWYELGREKHCSRCSIGIHHFRRLGARWFRNGYRRPGPTRAVPTMVPRRLLGPGVGWQPGRVPLSRQWLSSRRWPWRLGSRRWPWRPWS
jgi:hypothetical protein